MKRPVSRSRPGVLFFSHCEGPIALAIGAALALALPGRVRADASATTRFTAVTPGAAASGGVLYRQSSLPDELLSVGRGYPLLLEPSVVDPTTEHSRSIAHGSGSAFLQDSWSSPYGTAAITLNETQLGEGGLLYSDLSDRFAVDHPGDAVALRHATTAQATWQIATLTHQATHSLFVKLHGLLDPSPQPDRWLMASGKGAFTTTGGLFGSSTSPFEWVLGFDGGAAGSRPDFFALTLPSGWTVQSHSFLVGLEDFSLDLAASSRFTAPDDTTTIQLASTFSCAAFNAECAADTLAITDPAPPLAPAPAPLPLAGLGMVPLLARRLRRRVLACRREARSRCGSRQWVPLLARLGLGGALLSPVSPLLTHASHASRADDFQAMVALFRRYGFEVVATHQRCLLEPNLFGLYLRGTRRIVVCPRGNQLDTLLHEGWHAVQARCRQGKPLLTDAFLRAHLSPADRRDIDALYSAKSWHREAEARVMALQKLPLYQAHLESSCGALSAPVPGAAPAGVAGATAQPRTP